MNRFIAATVVAFISVTSAVAADFGDPAKAQPIANRICAACHGADGNSPLPMNPSLAGQHPEYLFKQLNEFKSGSRNNAVMMGMVAGVSAEDMRNLAAYYAAQKPSETAAKDRDLVAQGRKLFRGGNVATGVTACAGCHSPNGAGIPSQYPRLAGQHPEYVVAQLKAFRAGDRANDSNAMMRAVAGRLTDKEIAAVAEYLSALR
ncbi:MAG: c-type cytochrome [Burkholderiales bacterium]